MAQRLYPSLKRKKVFVSGMRLSVLVGIMLVHLVHAASSYVVIQRNSVTLGDGEGAINPYVKDFLLPQNVFRGDKEKRSAIIQFRATSIDLAHNEVYLNPPTDTCAPETADVNAAASIHTIPAVAGGNQVNDRTFSATRLQRGVACETDNDCTVSGVCQEALCVNRLMVCSRDSLGNLSGNLDDFDINSIVLHYKLPPYVSGE